MKVRFVVLAVAAIGIVGTMLPFASLSVKALGEGPAEKAAAEETAKRLEGDGAFSKNAWSFEDGTKAPGLVMGGAFVLACIFAGLIGATRLSRGLAIPMAIFSLIGLGLSTMAFSAEGTFTSKTVSGVEISIGPAIGCILLLLGYVGLLALGVYGTVRPDPKKAS